MLQSKMSLDFGFGIPIFIGREALDIVMTVWMSNESREIIVIVMRPQQRIDKSDHRLRDEQQFKPESASAPELRKTTPSGEMFIERLQQGELERFRQPPR